VRRQTYGYLPSRRRTATIACPVPEIRILSKKIMVYIDGLAEDDIGPFMEQGAYAASVCVQPFWRMSKCSQRMSPTYGGARRRNLSRPWRSRSTPRHWNWAASMPSRLKLSTAHCSHWQTCVVDHCDGSTCKLHNQLYELRKDQLTDEIE